VSSPGFCRVGREPERASAGSRPGRFLLAVVLLVPGGCLIALGVLVALPGLALCWSAVRRMTAATRGTVGDEIALPRSDSYEASRQPRPRAWSAPPSLEVH
jgi:hypothetical protein